MRALAARTYGASAIWIVAGAAVAFAVRQFALQKEMYLLAGLLAAYGLASAYAISRAKQGRPASMLGSIVGVP